MVEEKLSEGWKFYLVTFISNRIGGKRDAVKDQMLSEIKRIYGTSLTRIVRNPHSLSAAGSLPIWIVCPDFPVPKQFKQSLRDVALNDGLHYGGWVLMPPGSRLPYGLDAHFINYQAFYRRRGSPLLRRVVATPVTETPRKAVRYCLKSLERGRSTTDDIEICPRSRSELG